MNNMDALKERVLNERIRILNAKLDKALEQRDRFSRFLPYQERGEIIRECDDELENAGRPDSTGQGD